MSSYSMEHKQQAVSAGSLCYAAVLTALVFVLTFVPKIPIPLGYAQLGDAIIFASVLFSTRRQAALAASVGSALSDFIGGFPLWIIPTLIIKYVMVEAVFYTVRPDKREWKLTSPRVFLGFFLSAAWMVLSYTVSGSLLYGSWAVGIPMVPGLIGEGVVNMIAAYALAACLVKARFRGYGYSLKR